MDKYFALQCKRVLRFLPGVLLVIGLLLGCLLAAPKLLAQQDADSENNQKVAVALCGETDNSFLQMALSAVSTMDSSRYTLDIRQMEEPQAKEALSQGEIAAYVVFPEGFMQAAFAGEMLPLKMVSTTGASDIVSIFKEELTDVVGQLLSSSEKGVFGLDNAVREENLPHNQNLDHLALQYVEHIMVRDQVYRLEVLGVADQLTLWEYLTCGLGVLCLLLCCLPFAPLHIRQDPALGKLLRAKGHSTTAQTLCDLGAYSLTLLVIAAIALPLIAALSQNPVYFGSILRGIPVILMAAAYSFLMFNLADSLMTGVLMQFFVSLALCFVSGCIYPVYFFPIGVQKLAAYLPTGLARTQLAGCITGRSSTTATQGLLGYTALFAVLSIALRYRKIQGVAK